MLKILGQKNVNSVLIEGGAKIFASFLMEKAFDEMLFFIAPEIYPQGLDSFHSEILKKIGNYPPMFFNEIRRSGPDLMLRCIPEWNKNKGNI